mmetsp:Transcript_8865/g.19177  ORF Transcript_8865/g.19177 Transcript_8865/m.19177 type:complete len:243 (+) Transcript_8865:2659-3387(+)
MRAVMPMAAVGRPTGVIVNISNGSSGGSGSDSICALRTRLVEVPMSVHMPPSIEEKESGISRMCGERPFRAAQFSHTVSSIATIGVLFITIDMPPHGKHKRAKASRWFLGLPKNGRNNRSAARVSSRARASTNKAPIARMESEENPSHASSWPMILHSRRKVVVPRRTRSGAQSFAMSSRETSVTQRVSHASPSMHTSPISGESEVIHCDGTNGIIRHTNDPAMKMHVDIRRRLSMLVHTCI